ncbi:MAG: DUF4443 domain-containing protein [Candidatus Bathyarchaeia archaeon]
MEEVFQLKQVLRELVGAKALGPSPSFSAVHVLKALELIAEKPVGRNRLSKDLALGQGATRTLIERLKEKDLISVDRAGCILSKRGERVWRALRKVFPRKIVLRQSGLTVGRFNVAILVKNCGGRVRFGLEQRDAALMSGAEGATTLVFRDGKLAVPPEQRDVAEDFPRIYEELVNVLKPRENDVIIIGSADSPDKAEYGALAAMLTLLNNYSVVKW